MAERKKPGPPKTKDYTTVSLKIPQTLLDRVRAYARVHRRTVSELFRDGIEWRLGERKEPPTESETLQEVLTRHETLLNQILQALGQR
jgi:hypothetical protein